MGAFGRVSRVWSLKEGANLTYGAIGNVAAPGQIQVPIMSQALENLSNLHSRFEMASFLSGKGDFSFFSPYFLEKRTQFF